MPISPGSRLGPYEILAPLGAGGMGEVYRARDPRLGRDVAIKVLPAELSGDASRRARFEQEARSASALNHPNIVTLYDIGTHEGELYIAMEVVEGRSLRDLLGGGPLSIRKLLDVGAQIGDGLAKAHAAGIVHRDLKPENVMVSRDGFVKILDFGLAKLAEDPSIGLTAAPTAVAPPTEPGSVLGTVGYMSPEQASGQSVDFRSDQFTLGAILYEMAVGRRAFQRKTGAETLAAIIRDDPDPIEQANARIPAPVRWMVERCLAKDPEGRYASTKDLARDLASVRDHLSEASSSGALAAAEAARPQRRGWLAPAVLALLIGAGLALLGRSLLAGRAKSILDFRRLTYQRGTVFSARFAPDGETVVYSAAWDGRPMEIFSTRIEGHESRSLGLPSAELLSISSSGEMALSLAPRFFRGIQSAGTLARVPLGGGAPREVLENVQDADWSPDGKELAVARYVGNRCRLEYPIGHVLYEAAAWISHVRVSPDGSMVAFFDHPAPGDNTGRLRALDRNGKTRLEGPPGETGMGLAWSPRGDEIWSTSPLRATSLSGQVRAPWTLLGAQDSVYDISRSGRVLLSRNSSRREIIGSSGRGPERNLTALSYSYPLDLSRDGRLVLVSEENRVPYGIYLRKLDGSPAVLLGEGQGYQLSPDGKWAVATTEIGSDTLLFLPTGAGETRKVIVGIACQWVSFFPDGQRVLIAGNAPGRRVRLYTMAVSGGTPLAITGEGVSVNAPDPFSPDGRSVVAVDAEGRIAIYPVGAGESHLVPAVQPGDTVIRWSADGRSLFVFNPSTRPDVVELLEVQTGKRTVWREFRASDPAGVMRIAPFDVTPDGGSYVYSYRRILDDLYAVSGLR